MNLAVLAVAILVAQQPPAQNAQEENRELISTLQDANNSPPDVIHNLEEFLKKHPAPAQINEIERVLARAAIDAKDDRRTVLYGEKALKSTPDDMLLLDRVARALLAMGGEENARASLPFSRAFEEKVEKAGQATGGDAARRQDDRDRGESRALLYQARAETILGDLKEAERLAAHAFEVYPSEEAARAWAQALESQGLTKDAIERYADAFAIPDPHATDQERAEDRRHLAELERKLHHSEKGLGDQILAAYDATSAMLDARRARLAAIDPNFAVTDPMQFHLSGLDGGQLAMASLKGSVIVVDFWATWCVPCRAQHPLYEQVMQRFRDRKDVIFLSIDTDEDHTPVSAFVDQNHWSRKVYFEDGLQRLLQIGNIPTTILIDKNGRIASRMNGYLPDKFADQLTERIKDALAE